MSRVAWIDASVGVAGDMLLAALLDAGADVGRVRDGLAALGLEGWELRVEEVRRGSFRARRVSVILDGVEADAPSAGEHDHVHDHDHDHDHHGQHHPWRDIRERITGAALPPRAKARALAAYGRLAEAEAKLHGMAVDDVELHEVGSRDAVIDIVGACLALEDLGVDALFATPLPMGTGHVHAAHGTLPLPAPATLEVLLGWPIVPSPWPGEWVTPTGAALIAALATPGLPPMTPLATGHGAGRRDPHFVANLVRVVIGEGAVRPGDEVVELACQLDDMTGELVPALLQRLLDEGALDAWATPILMKKGRPGLLVEALCEPARADALSDALLRHSTTLGVRRSLRSRAVLERWERVVETPFGAVRVKVGGRDGVAWHAAPEFEDVAAAAAAAGVPLHEVYRHALAAWTEGA